MLRELLSIFRPSDPLAAMGMNFSHMLDIAREMTLDAGRIFFGEETSAEARTKLYSRDVEVNGLERTIRKQVVAHLALQANNPSLPYCLALVSLVKDIERIGDYAKNLSEVPDLGAGTLPDDELVAELREIRNGVEEQFAVASVVFHESDASRAIRLIEAGRSAAHRADALVGRIARASHTPATTAALVLGTRHYKRIGGHLLNLLTSVVMPLHKIDYFDEDSVVEPPETVTAALADED